MTCKTFPPHPQPHKSAFLSGHAQRLLLLACIQAPDAFEPAPFGIPSKAGTLNQNREMTIAPTMPCPFYQLALAHGVPIVGYKDAVASGLPSSTGLRCNQINNGSMRQTELPGREQHYR
jgi:hypothetical protein